METTAANYERDFRLVIHVGEQRSYQAKPEKVHEHWYPDLTSAVYSLLMLDHRPFFEPLEDQRYYQSVYVMHPEQGIVLVLGIHPPPENVVALECRLRPDYIFQQTGIRLPTLLTKFPGYAASVSYMKQGQVHRTLLFQQFVDDLETARHEKSCARRLPFVVDTPATNSVTEWRGMEMSTVGQQRHRFAELDLALRAMCLFVPDQYGPEGTGPFGTTHGPVLRREPEGALLGSMALLPPPPDDPRAEQPICLLLAPVGWRLPPLANAAYQLPALAKDLRVIAKYQKNGKREFDPAFDTLDAKSLKPQWENYMATSTRLELVAIEHNTMDGPITITRCDCFEDEQEALFHLFTLLPHDHHGTITLGDGIERNFINGRILNSDNERIAELAYCLPGQTDHHMPQPGMYLVTEQRFRSVLAAIGPAIGVCEPMALGDKVGRLEVTPLCASLKAALRTYVDNMDVQRQLLGIMAAVNDSTPDGPYVLRIQVRHREAIYGQRAATAETLFHFIGYDAAYLAMQSIASPYFQNTPDTKISVTAHAAIWLQDEHYCVATRAHPEFHHDDFPQDVSMLYPKHSAGLSANHSHIRRSPDEFSGKRHPKS